MLIFAKLGKLGRLGNQLFQYSALRGLAIKNNYNLKIPFNVSIFQGQEYLLKNFSIPEIFFSKKIFFYSLFAKKYKEVTPIKIDKKFFQLSDNTNIEGYFQSIYYFSHCIDVIKKELTPKPDYLKLAEIKFQEIKKKFSSYEIVSLHLRRGDNVDPEVANNDIKLLNLYGENNFDRSSFYGQYLENAKKIFKKKKVKFLIFSGGDRLSDDNTTDIEWCKKNLFGDEYIYLPPQKSFDDFCLIRQCDHNIISPVSSFGWWAAFLNPKKNSIIVAPRVYDPTLKEINYRFMFYPKHWIII